MCHKMSYVKYLALTEEPNVYTVYTDTYKCQCFCEPFIMLWASGILPYKNQIGC